MRYYETISTLSKSELSKEAKKNIESLEQQKIAYKREIQQFLSNRFHIKEMKLEELSGDVLYLLNVQLNIILNNGSEKL